MTRRSTAQYNWDKLEFDETLLTLHFTAPRQLKIAFVVAHHMTIVGTGTGSALTACYNTWQTRQASAHYGVDGNYVRQFVWDRDAAWATADHTGNHAGISIEHANSTRDPQWLVSDTTWKNGAKLAAHLHKVYGLGRPVSGVTLRKHKDFYATACPGPFLGGTNWAAYVHEAQRVYDTLVGTTPAPVPAPAPDPDPVPAPTVVKVKTVSQNVAGYNADNQPGVTGYKTHIPNIATAVIGHAPDLFATQELSNRTIDPQRPLMDSKLSGHLTRVSGGSDGRYLYKSGGILKVASGVFQAAAATLYNGDDKQAAWIAYRKGGILAMDISAHTENEAPADEERVQQTLSFLNQGIAKMHSLGGHQANMLLIGDFNSDSLVASRLAALGWTTAGKGGNYETTATFRGWDRQSHHRVDYGFVRKGVLATLVVERSVDSDHERIIVIRTLTP